MTPVGSLLQKYAGAERVADDGAQVLKVLAEVDVATTKLKVSPCAGQYIASIFEAVVCACVCRIVGSLITGNSRLRLGPPRLEEQAAVVR
jgi:hypothetical protein